ncbi:Phytocyanin domain [Dillenia turbinata]|uniref:Phytocyanin domain n=1 Tax=Dillenia turbinata TaxID=194707 RepID=A0AAN8ZJ32_9MAGN
MGFGYTAKAFILLVAFASTLAHTKAKTIVVGGSAGWTYGFNYTKWAHDNCPFYFKDTLVFKYDPPTNTTPPHAHSVYLLPNLWSWIKCDFRRAKMLANTTQGTGDGFGVVLNKWMPYYFACGEGPNHLHCNNGTMKFIAWPFWRWN